MKNKWDRRDAKRAKAHKMKVDGAGNKVLQAIIMKKAEEAKNREQPSLV